MLFKQQARRLNHNCIFAFCVGNYFFLRVDFKLQLFNFDLETILDLITNLLTSMAAMVLVAVISFQFIAENFLWEQIAVINIFAKKKLFFPKHTIADHYKKNICHIPQQYNRVAGPSRRQLMRERENLQRKETSRLAINLAVFTNIQCILSGS